MDNQIAENNTIKNNFAILIKKANLSYIIGITIQLLFFMSIENPLLRYGAVGCLFLCSILLTIENAFILFIFLLPNQRLFTFPQDNSSILFLILFVIFIKLIITKNVHLKHSHIFFFFIIILYSIFTIYYVENFSNLTTVSKVIIYLLVPLAIFKKKLLNKKWHSEIINALAIGCLATSLLSIVFAEGVNFDPSTRFDAGEYNNPNIFSSIISYSIASLLTIALISKQISLKNILLIIALLVIGLSTQSRSFMLAMTLSLTYIIILGVFINRYRKAAIIILIMSSLLALSFLLINDSIIYEFISASLNRILNPRQGDISGKRIELWITYSNILKSNLNYLLWGVGSNNPQIVLGVDFVAHNSIIELIISWGLIGASIFIAFFYNIWISFRRMIPKTDKLNSSFLGLLPFLIQVQTSMTGHNILNMAFITLMFISFQTIIIGKQ